MVCRASRTVWINAVGFCPCQLGLSNKVGLSDPDFTSPSCLNAKVRISRLPIKGSFLNDHSSLRGFPGVDLAF